MYSKEEAQRLKREFWISFAQKYPHKWLLYDTKIKDLSFKFFADNKKAQVLISIETRNDETRVAYFNKFVALKSILKEEFVKDLIFEEKYFFENGKIISQIWVEKLDVSISNKNKWDAIFDFFNEKMSALEIFYSEYDAFIKDI